MSIAKKRQWSSPDYADKMKQRYHGGFTSQRIQDLRQAFAGENNPRWKGGISSDRDKVRHTPALKCWKKNVLKRDNYTCRECGIRGGYLEAHHIKEFSNYPELRFDLDNGLTLCLPCHKKTDNYAGRVSADKVAEKIAGK